MQTNANQEGTGKLEEIVATAYELGGRIASDDATVAALAARRLERILVRGGNLRLQSALLRLARELEPSGRRASIASARRAAAAH